MAVFGAQTVVSLILLSFLQKICPIYSFGRWLLTKQGLIRYLYPTNEELKSLSGNGNRMNGGKKPKKYYRNDQQNHGESFQVSRSIELSLSNAPITTLDILPLRYFADFIWVLDFAITTCIVVTLTYIHEHCLSPHSNEYGLSSVWCFLLVTFSIRPLLSIVSSYKIGQNSGEIVLCTIFGFFFLISAMVVLIINDKLLEFHLEEAHDLFTKSANAFLSKRELSTIGAGSLITFRTILAVISGFIGSLLTFPGLRIAKCHMDSLVIMQDRPFMQLLMYVEFLLPLFLISLWVPPISRIPLIGKVLPGTDVVITNSIFDLCRDVAIVIFLISRMCLLRHRLQAYLNTACTKLEVMRKEAGKVSNTEIQSSVTQVFYYLCVVSIQLVAPVALLAGTMMMTHSFTSAEVVTAASPTAAADTDSLLQSVQSNAQEFTIALAELRAVFSAHLLQRVTSYFIWFTLFAWTTTSFFGVFYHNYLMRA